MNFHQLGLCVNNPAAFVAGLFCFRYNNKAFLPNISDTSICIFINLE